MLLSLQTDVNGNKAIDQQPEPDVLRLPGHGHADKRDYGDHQRAYVSHYYDNAQAIANVNGDLKAM
ncbi:hypothetical protein ACVXG7_09230 [Enterobacter hormaechei]